jgi:hypothetical protein
MDHKVRDITISYQPSPHQQWHSDIAKVGEFIAKRRRLLTRLSVCLLAVGGADEEKSELIS